MRIFHLIFGSELGLPCIREDARWATAEWGGVGWGAERIGVDTTCRLGGLTLVAESHGVTAALTGGMNSTACT